MGEQMPHLNLFVSLFVVATYMLIKVPKLSNLPRREKNTLLDRWAANFSYEVVNQIILFVGALVLSTEMGHLFFPHQKKVSTPSILIVVILVFTLDFFFYWRHRFYHRYLMRIHKTHHPDQDFDLTLSFRIHPIEMLIQTIVFMAVVFVFKLDRWQTMIINMIFTVQAFYSHFELSLFSEKINKWLSIILVVPDFHQVHHQNKVNCHFGFLFNIWDKIFGTATQVTILRAKDKI